MSLRWQAWIAAMATVVCLGAAPAVVKGDYANLGRTDGPPQAPSESGQTSFPLAQPCAPGTEIRTSDLCAQWKSADAASEGARWTARTFWLSVIGTLFGAGTLIAAFMAARYAKHAAQEARRSADIAKDAMVASERAWLVVEPFAESDITADIGGGAHLFVALAIKNIGRTPALNAHTSMRLVTSHGDLPTLVAEHAREHRSKNESWSRTVLPGESYRRPWGLTEEHSGGDFGYSPILIGCVTYETLPDRALHQTAFCYFVGPENIADDRRSVPQSDVAFTVTTGGFAD